MRMSRRPSDEAVSEVIGQILIFGILSMVLVLSLLSFNIAKDNAEDRIVLATQDAVAQRVAGLVIDSALLAEKFQDQELSLTAQLELDQQIEGRDYTIDLDNDAVRVTVGSTGRTASAPLFSVDSGNLVHVCDAAAVDGGSIHVRVIHTSDFATVAPDCGAATAATADFFVFIETLE